MAARNYTSSKESRLFHAIFVRSWWVILFIVFCIVGYDQSVQLTDHEYERLLNQAHALEEYKLDALMQQKELSLQLNSTNDRNWMELTLMRRLGLVPQGYIKIYFQNTPQS